MCKDALLHLSQLEKQGGLEVLRHIRHGIEKEGLRVTAAGKISQSMHPNNLGATLTHPYITTDYSEALLEFITPVFTSVDDTLGFLNELHLYMSGFIGDELIWTSSMPARLDGDDNIPVAYFGTSNIGQMKFVYRQGLAHRYGKSMQTIAGIHYNFSLPSTLWPLIYPEKSAESAASEGYIGLIRNFSRYSWLLMYLFGASPAIDKSFLSEDKWGGLAHLSEDTLYLPWATSLRMSDIGYTNKVQDKLNICYNGLDEYITSLSEAIGMPYAPYEAIGVEKEGRYLQLNTNILQIENEYYSTIRPKRVVERGEKPLHALRDRGVEYVEVRCLDINPLTPLGIDRDTAYFTDVFLTFCALSDSPEIEKQECDAIKNNFYITVHEGRKPGVSLQVLQDGKMQARTLKECGQHLIEAMRPVADALDRANDTCCYSNSLSLQEKKLIDSELTPSALVLQNIKESEGSFLSAMLALSKKHQQQFLEQVLPEDRAHYFDNLAKQSLLAQKKIESEDTMDFDAFLANYFAS